MVYDWILPHSKQISLHAWYFFLGLFKSQRQLTGAQDGIEVSVGQEFPNLKQQAIEKGLEHQCGIPQLTFRDGRNLV